MQIVSGVCLISSCITGLSLLFQGDVSWRVIAFLLSFFIILWGVSRLWTPVVVLGPIGIVFGLVWSLRENSMGLYQRSWATPSLVEWALFITGALILCVPVVLCELSVASATEEERNLIALPKGKTLGFIPAIFAVLGAHPVYKWLPWRRQFVAAGLFALCQLMIGVSVFMTIFFFPTYLIGVGRQLECLFATYKNWGECLGGITGTTAMPALWLAFFLGLAAGLRFVARRFSWTSLELVRRQDRRRSVLFLRSFSDDQVRLSRPAYRFFERLILLGEPRPLLDHLLLEEGPRVGPVVAIGAPGSRPPFGAIRTYVTNDEWKNVVAEMADAASIVVIAVDKTDGVLWELDYLERNNHRLNVLYLLPPSFAPSDKAVNLIAAAGAFSSELAASLELLGRFLQISTHSCIGWYTDASASLTVLTTEHPTEVSYLLAIRKYLSSFDPALTR